MLPFPIVRLVPGSVAEGIPARNRAFRKTKKRGKINQKNHFFRCPNGKNKTMQKRPEQTCFFRRNTHLIHYICAAAMMAVQITENHLR